MCLCTSLRLLFGAFIQCETAVLTYGDEENEEGGAPPSLEAMHQKAQQMAAQHAQQGHHPVGHHAGAPPGHGNARGVEELDELIKKKEEEIRKGKGIIISKFLLG